MLVKGNYFYRMLLFSIVLINEVTIHSYLSVVRFRVDIAPL